MPSFKFTTGGGVSEMSRGVGGPNKKPFYAGWASFIKHAHSHQARQPWPDSSQPQPSPEPQPSP